MKKPLRNYVIAVLRRGTFKWKPREEAKQLAKIQIGEYSTGRPKYGYMCRLCGEVVKGKDINMDHVDPVIPLNGFKSGLEFDLNEIAERMFPEADGWQVLCKSCHDKKTKEENSDRRTNKTTRRTRKDSGKS